MPTSVPALTPQPNLPPILAGYDTPATQQRVEHFYSQVAQLFERWVKRRQSVHTQRAYREDVMSFVRFSGMQWPENATFLLAVSLLDVQAFREEMLTKQFAPKTLNRRIASLSSFYKYLAAAASELRLPITVPNPAHAQFIARESADPREETKALTATRARQLMNLPSGEDVLAYRDRAVLKTFLYSGIRIDTACRLKVSDFHQDERGATLKLREKGDKHRVIGLHYQAAQAIQEYLEKGELTNGPLFRPRLNARSQTLGRTAMTTRTMYRLVGSYLGRLPSAMKEFQHQDGHTRKECLYSPHSLRATTATLLLGCGRGHPQGPRAAWPPAHHHDPDLRQATAQHRRGRLP